VTFVAAAVGTKTLWYATRGTGVVALLLLTASVVLGTLSSARWRTVRLPRFLVGGLHRNLTLLTVAFVTAHVVTGVADRFAPIGLKDGVLPFLSQYRPIWLGLGTVAFDLILALVVTSLLRARLGLRVWRGIHWLAYGSWPVALVHALGTGSDARVGWLMVVGFSSCALVISALVLRALRSEAHVGPRLAGVAAALIVPLAIFAWYMGGPARVGWAARAGTPASLLRRPVTSVAQPIAVKVPQSLSPQTFAGQLTGTVKEGRPAANGLVKININATFDGDVPGRLRLTLWGRPSNQGVSLAASDVAFGAAGTTEAYVGRVVGLRGNRVEARVRNAAGHRVELTLNLQLDQQSGTVAGVLQGRSA
jgi:hypothetical protein